MATDAQGNLTRDFYFGQEEPASTDLYEPENITINFCEIEHSKGILDLSGGLHSFQVMYSILSDSAKALVSVLDTTEV